MKRCKYCNRKLNDERMYCCDKCKMQGERYFEKWKRYKMMYCSTVLISLILIVTQVVFFPKMMIISKIFIMILGATLYALPFGNTIDSMGIEKTTRIARLSAMLLIIVAPLSIIF